MAIVGCSNEGRRALLQRPDPLGNFEASCGALAAMVAPSAPFG